MNTSNIWRTDQPRAQDHEAIETASREKRAVVTNNVKDFRPLDTHVSASQTVAATPA